MDNLRAETEYARKVLDALSMAASTIPTPQIDKDKTHNAAGCMTAFLCSRLASKGTSPEAIERTTFQWSNGVINVRNAVKNHLWTNLRPTFTERFNQLSVNKPSAYLMVAWQPIGNGFHVWAIPGSIVHGAMPRIPFGKVKDKRSVSIIPGKNVFEKCEGSPDLLPFYRSMSWSEEERVKLIEAVTTDKAARRRNRSQGDDLPPNIELDERADKECRRYWWLNANPKIWDFRAAPVGSVETYTSRNEAGNKRQKYKHFAAVRPGDLLLGYVTNPDKEIVAVCEITKALHNAPEGEAIEFRKIEEFSVPVAWAELKSVPELAHCEPLVSNQGSLFAVTAGEYDAIRAIIDERNLAPKVSGCEPFTKADALNGLFMTVGKLDEILARLRRKKAIILQGPPGVGKTFIARRLAFAIMGERDDRRVAMVQFHPSYGYEDFVQGYRPTHSGLERRDGVFYQFARLARNDPNRDWFFIIDEINRGNLAKIFGELLMLIEADKRGLDHAIPLTYSEQADETFHIPSNLHFIGTMNTADRSLAMVDYALRRRFAFVTLNPAFDSPAFEKWLAERGATAELITRIRERLSKLNEEIEKERDLGPGFRVGHSFFCPAKDHTPDDAWYREIIAGEIQPLLEEYFDSRERVAKLVSDLLA